MGLFMSVLMSLPVQTVAPTVAPIHINEVKRPLRLTDCDPDRDEEIQRYIDAAVEQLQDDTLTQFVAATFSLKMPDFPDSKSGGFIHDGDILLPRVPLLSFDSLTYYNTSNVSTTVTASDYFVQSERYPPMVQVDRDGGEYWPDVYERHDAVTATFKAGHLVPLTPDESADTFTSTGYTYSDDDTLTLSISGGTLPDGFSTTTTYYVVNSSSTTFQLATSSGGSAITFVSKGSGYLFGGRLPAGVYPAIVSLVRAWYCGECAMGCKNATYESLMHRLRWEVVV